MSEDLRGSDKPDLPLQPPKNLSDVVQSTLLQLAAWQETLEKIKERNRTSQIKPPKEPPEVIP